MITDFCWIKQFGVLFSVVSGAGVAVGKYTKVHSRSPFQMRNLHNFGVQCSVVVVDRKHMQSLLLLMRELCTTNH